ncbi:MAG: hypothetical protein ACJAS1_005019, partial [Oleiphilaceae bacterium]
GKRKYADAYINYIEGSDIFRHSVGNVVHEVNIEQLNEKIFNINQPYFYSSKMAVAYKKTLDTFNAFFRFLWHCMRHVLQIILWAFEALNTNNEDELHEIGMIDDIHYSKNKSIFDDHIMQNNVDWENTTPMTNPATGLPMLGEGCCSTDIMGNPYGTDLNESNHHIL